MSAEEDILKALQKSEKRYNLFKSSLIIVMAATTIGVVIFTSNRLYLNSTKNRELLRCTLQIRTQDRAESIKLLNDCLNKTK